MDENLSIGMKLRLKSTGEVGIVIWTWHNEFLVAHDCYVAFFGKELPAGEPSETPYVLKYLSTSLERID